MKLIEDQNHETVAANQFGMFDLPVRFLVTTTIFLVVFLERETSSFTLGEERRPNDNG